MNRTLIISGGSIDIEFARNIVNCNKYDNVIAVDGGLKAADELKIMPNYIVGDFDTIEKTILEKYAINKDITIRRFNPEKDFTDTHSAMMLAVEINSFSVDIIGAIGTRLDHSLANIQLLQIASSNGIDAVILDKTNLIRLLSPKRREYTVTKKSDYKYVSLVPMTDEVKGVTTSGLKYNLNNFDFNKQDNVSLGVSNEVVGDEGCVRICDGMLLLIESRD